MILQQNDIHYTKKENVPGTFFMYKDFKGKTMRKKAFIAL